LSLLICDFRPKIIARPHSSFHRSSSSMHATRAQTYFHKQGLFAHTRFRPQGVKNEKQALKRNGEEKNIIYLQMKIHINYLRSTIF
jgi:hypothetical protein